MQGGVRFDSVVYCGEQRDALQDEAKGTEYQRTHRSQQTGHVKQASISAVSDANHNREVTLQRALQSELGRVDPAVLPAIARALEHNADRLVGGSWGVGDDDDDGCLLTLAARELGLHKGEELLGESIAAVRIPALFDELWICILERTGDTRSARSIIHRLVIETLALGATQAAVSETPAGSSLPDSDRSALTR